MFSKKVMGLVIEVICAPLLWMGIVWGAVGPFTAIPNGDSNPLSIS
mgnify:CR=1 FL=1